VSGLIGQRRAQVEAAPLNSKAQQGKEVRAELNELPLASEV
jgi:hypothetical protein